MATRLTIRISVHCKSAVAKKFSFINEVVEKNITQLNIHLEKILAVHGKNNVKKACTFVIPNKKCYLFGRT